jgi:hypothetical protein
MCDPFFENLDDRAGSLTSVDEVNEGPDVSLTLQYFQSRDSTRRSRTPRRPVGPFSSFQRDVDGVASLERRRCGSASEKATPQGGGGRTHFEHRIGEHREVKFLMTAADWSSDRREKLRGDPRAEGDSDRFASREEGLNRG